VGAKVNGIRVLCDEARNGQSVDIVTADGQKLNQLGKILLLLVVLKRQ